MYNKILPIGVLLALATGCASADVDPIVVDQNCVSNCGPGGGKADEFETPVEVSGPILLCHIIEGSDADGEFFQQDALECLVTEEPGFRMNFAAVRATSPEQLEESAFPDDRLIEPQIAATFVGESKYPIDVRLSLDFVVTVVSPSSGDVQEQSEHIECDTRIESPTDTIECGKSFQQWTLEIVPDAELQAAWDAGEHRAAAFDMRINPLSGDSITRWDFVVRKGEVLAQTLKLLINPADVQITLQSKVPYNNDVPPIPLIAPGSYELHADGSLTQ